MLGPNVGVVRLGFRIVVVLSRMLSGIETTQILCYILHFSLLLFLFGWVPLIVVVRLVKGIVVTVENQLLLR